MWALMLSHPQQNVLDVMFYGPWLWILGVWLLSLNLTAKNICIGCVTGCCVFYHFPRYYVSTGMQKQSQDIITKTVLSSMTTCTTNNIWTWATTIIHVLFVFMMLTHVMLSTFNESNHRYERQVKKNSNKIANKKYNKN